MAERRSKARQKSFLRGRVFFNNRRHSADCLVRDMSDHGAKLVFADAVVLPDVIELHLSNKDAIQRAEVQWRRGKEVGVGFGADEKPNSTEAAVPGDVSARVI